jgi:8-oxo-dGTP diphosphatase
MEKRTANLILVNSRGEVLLQLRDNIPTIPYPNTWCLPGGHIEGDETPEQCLVREMREEMGIAIEGLTYFTERSYPSEVEYFFAAHMDLNVDEITLIEGQTIAWFAPDAIEHLAMTRNDGIIVQTYFAQVED